MHRLLLISLALVLAPAPPAWPTASLLEVASAQDLQRPRGVTPTIDSEDEPEDQRLSIEFNRRFQVPLEPVSARQRDEIDNWGVALRATMQLENRRVRGYVAVQLFRVR